MIVVGIHDGHNASVAVLDSGRIVAAIEEERLTRVKNQGGFPERALAAALATAGLTEDDIDVVAAAGREAAAGFVPAEARSASAVNAYHQDVLTGRDRLFRMRKAVSSFRQTSKFEDAINERDRAFRERFPNAQIMLIEHHHCHAAAAYYGGGLTEDATLVLTADGEGDGLSATVNVGKGRELRRVAEIEREHSLGWPYEAVTYVLGMQPFEHEYKVMGLAAYAAEAPQAQELDLELRRWISHDAAGMTWSRTRGAPPMHRSTRALARLIGRRRFDHVAAGVQSFIEWAVTTWVSACIEETGIRRIAVAGGVFMNVKANQKILELEEVDSLYVLPSCSDTSNSIGAAYAAFVDAGAGSPMALGPLYLGDDFTSEEIEAAFRAQDRSDWRMDWPEDPEAEVAGLLASGRIVARAKGRMEFGARALGNRSILADPSRAEAVDVLNRAIKARDFWMPFAPVATSEAAERYVVKPKKAEPFVSPYMMVAFDAVPEKVGAFHAAMHRADRTARLQELDESWNPDLYRLLKTFESLQGESILLNTSFNLHGFPIVRTPHDALSVFASSSLTHLQLGDALISKDIH